MTKLPVNQIITRIKNLRKIAKQQKIILIKKLSELQKEEANMKRSTQKSNTNTCYDNIK